MTLWLTSEETLIEYIDQAKRGYRAPSTGGASNVNPALWPREVF